MSITKEYDIDVYYQGRYHPVEAILLKGGKYTMCEDGYVQIEEEPEFSYSLVGNDNPDDELVVVAREFLKEIYWNETLMLECV